MCVCVYAKDSEIIHKSFLNRTNRVIWDFCSSETNPRTEFFEHRRQNESTKWIFWTPYGFANPNPKDLYGFVLFIVHLCTKDFWGFVGFVNTGWIFEKLRHKSNPWNESFEHRRGNRICKSKLYYTSYILQVILYHS